MENKHNFMGIILPVVVAVILLSVLPVLTNMSPDYDIGQLNVNPDFSSGDYIVDKGSHDYIDSATIIKDENLIPENIKKDVNIFGIVGTLEEGEGGLASGNIYLTVDSLEPISVSLGDINNVPYDYYGQTTITSLDGAGIGLKPLSVTTGSVSDFECFIAVINSDGTLKLALQRTTSPVNINVYIDATDLVFIFVHAIS